LWLATWTRRKPVSSKVRRPTEGSHSRTEASEAEEHAALRIIDGFTVDQVIGEFRALRASILRLWIKHRSADIQTDPTQITRFNESIDQMVSESVGRHGHLESQAREHSTRRDAFLATLSHELRGPLAAIVNGVNIVTVSAATHASLAPVAAMMSRQAQHLRRLLDDLLDFARISGNRLSISCGPTDLRQSSYFAVSGNALRKVAARFTESSLRAGSPIPQRALNYARRRTINVRLAALREIVRAVAGPRHGAGVRHRRRRPCPVTHTLRTK
jgi:hypothetical protein